MTEATEGRIEVRVTGGCQCGAVRYRADAVLDHAHLCHCRMCQKAVGNLFAALVPVPREALTWSRGTPARFMSSDPVARGFCAACGTPLFYDYVDGDRVNLTMGSLDEAARFAPQIQYGQESRMPWFAMLPALPQAGTTEAVMPEEAAVIAATSHQHPDHDIAD